MPAPFTCPHCGSHDYTVVLSGCEISGGVLQESFEWDKSAGDYASTGALLVESEAIEHEEAGAICNSCEKDVSEAVTEYEASLEAGSGDAAAQA